MSQRRHSERLLSGALPHLMARELRRQSAWPPAPGCPDADLLAAYAEKVLPAAEEHAIVEHLNGCQTCRMAVTFALRAGMASGHPSRLQGMLQVPAPAGSAWLPWGVVGGVAAGLLVAFVLFWQHPRPVSAPVQQARLEAPAAIAAVEQQPPVPVPSSRSRALRLHGPVPLQPAPTPSSAGKLTAAHVTAPASVAKASSPLPIRQGFVTLSTPSGAQLHPVLPGMEVASTSLNADAPPPAAAQSGNSLPVSGVAAFASSIPMASSFLGEPVSAQPHASLVSSASRESSDRLGFSRYLGYAPAATVWRISSTGALEHAAGRGQWVRVPLQAAGRLLSLTVSGTHLWALSQSGILYHSADAGQSWHPLHLDLDGQTMQDAIVGVHFTGQQQGELITRSGARWFTLDGGHFWRPVIASAPAATHAAGH